MIGRFIVLNTIGVGLLVAAYLLGILPQLMSVDKWLAMPGIGAVTLLGLMLVARKRFEDAEWLHNHMPLLGLLLTVLGTVMGAIHFHTSGDYKAFQMDVITAMLGTLSGMLSYLWLNLNLKVLR
jgi:TctA family transporter